MIVETKLSDVVEQYQINGAWHVGRRVLFTDDSRSENVETPFYLSEKKCWINYVLFQHASGRQVFVDPAILRPCEKIEEPK